MPGSTCVLVQVATTENISDVIIFSPTCFSYEQSYAAMIVNTFNELWPIKYGVYTNEQGSDNGVHLHEQGGWPLIIPHKPYDKSHMIKLSDIFL